MQLRASDIHAPDGLSTGPSKVDFLHICKTCEDPCCNGSIFVTEEERSRIIRAAGRDPFERGKGYLQHNCNECDFVQAGRCSVHEDRPMVCRLYPLYPVPHGKWIRVQIDEACPAAAKLSDAYVEEMKDRARRFFSGPTLDSYQSFWEGV